MTPMLASPFGEILKHFLHFFHCIPIHVIHRFFKKSFYQKIQALFFSNLWLDDDVNMTP